MSGQEKVKPARLLFCVPPAVIVLAVALSQDNGAGLSGFSRQELMFGVAAGLSLAMYFLYRFIRSFALNDSGRAQGKIVGTILLVSPPAIWLFLSNCLPADINLETMGNQIWSIDMILGAGWLLARYVLRFSDDKKSVR